MVSNKCSDYSLPDLPVTSMEVSALHLTVYANIYSPTEVLASAAAVDSTTNCTCDIFIFDVDVCAADVMQTKVRQLE
jgi:hypothetical protein